MKKINIYITINKHTDIIDIDTTDNVLKITISFTSIKESNYNIVNSINKMGDIISIYNDITNIHITFDKMIKDEMFINNILSKINNILYKYKNNNIKISLHNVPSISIEYIDELQRYKDIVMDPTKTPDTYLKYVLSRIPFAYKSNVFKISKDKKYKPTKMFPLTKCVGAGSNFNSYFVYIEPKKIQKNKKTLYLIGKAVTFDSGGMNIKNDGIENMKNDMTGSAILVSVLHLLNWNKLDKKYNIHLFIPIVENMIGSMATRPGMTVDTMSGKTVELVDMDAEGRLCIVDAIDYININLIKKNNNMNSIILDIATLTGNTFAITNAISCIMLSNMRGIVYKNKMIEIGETVGEYVDYLQIRDEYLDTLNTPVADIANYNSSERGGGCITAGAFINYFIDSKIPWVHLDVASNTFVNNISTSYGINLLYYFISTL